MSCRTKARSAISVPYKNTQHNSKNRNRRTNGYVQYTLLHNTPDACEEVTFLPKTLQHSWTAITRAEHGSCPVGQAIKPLSFPGLLSVSKTHLLQIMQVQSSISTPGKNPVQTIRAVQRTMAHMNIIARPRDYAWHLSRRRTTIGTCMRFKPAKKWQPVSGNAYPRFTPTRNWEFLRVPTDAYQTHGGAF